MDYTYIAKLIYNFFIVELVHVACCIRDYLQVHFLLFWSTSCLYVLAKLTDVIVFVEIRDMNFKFPSNINNWCLRILV